MYNQINSGCLKSKFNLNKLAAIFGQAKINHYNMTAEDSCS